jgi:hypothetical protein
MRKKQLVDQVRESGSLLERLKECQHRVAAMCAERRPPKMTIPVQWNDDDWFINRTIDDAIETLKEKE